MSIFEILMLICFGIAWPVSIWKSFISRTNKGKSLMFMLVVFFGYIAGVLHKINYNYDPVTYLYALNGTLIFIDILIYYRNFRFETARD